eukprot:1323726-Rhodomonas_salina.3
MGGRGVQQLPRARASCCLCWEHLTQQAPRPATSTSGQMASKSPLRWTRPCSAPIASHFELVVRDDHNVGSEQPLRRVVAERVER